MLVKLGLCIGVAGATGQDLFKNDYPFWPRQHVQMKTTPRQEPRQNVYHLIVLIFTTYQVTMFQFSIETSFFLLLSFLCMVFRIKFQRCSKHCLFLAFSKDFLPQAWTFLTKITRIICQNICKAWIFTRIWKSCTMSALACNLTFSIWSCGVTNFMNCYR